MEPFTVEAWVAFLEIFVQAIKAIAWPAFAVFAVLLFRESLRSLLARIRSISRNGAELDPIEQTTERLAETSGGSGNQDFGETEVHLKLWLDAIEAKFRTGGVEIGNSPSERALFWEAAYAARRADFLDVWRQIFGSQVALMFKLVQAKTLSSQSIWEAYRIHENRVRERSDTLEPLTIDNWVAFLTNFSLAEGDRNQLQLTLIGQDFVDFIRGLNLNDLHKEF